MSAFTYALMATGFGLACGFVFPCLNGPGNILKLLREIIGKPFSCPVCSGVWGAFVFGCIITYLPYSTVIAFGTPGWVMFLQHVSGYEVFFDGMEDEDDGS